MAKIKVRVTDTGMWDNCDNDRIVLDTDKVLVAVEDDEAGKVMLVMGLGADDYMYIDMTYEAYSAIACQGFEEFDLLTNLVT